MTKTITITRNAHANKSTVAIAPATIQGSFSRTPVHRFTEYGQDTFNLFKRAIEANGEKAVREVLEGMCW